MGVRGSRKLLTHGTDFVRAPPTFSRPYFYPLTIKIVPFEVSTARKSPNCGTGPNFCVAAPPTFVTLCHQIPFRELSNLYCKKENYPRTIEKGGDFATGFFPGSFSLIVVVLTSFKSFCIWSLSFLNLAAVIMFDQCNLVFLVN